MFKGYIEKAIEARKWDVLKKMRRRKRRIG